MLSACSLTGLCWEVSGVVPMPLNGQWLSYARACAVSSAHKAGLSLDLRKMHNGTQFLERPRPRHWPWRAGAELSALPLVSIRPLRY